ncbi:MAG TPA: AsmA family protein [Reyranellaceae bacterium]|nr:AsmA family protein [Reyranellaceae bacterium]
MKLFRGVRKVWLWTGGAIGAVLLAMLAAPYVIDVEHYKPAMAEAVKRATGRELVVEGKMQLSMFPTPRITARKVRFANAVGAKGAQMVDVRRVSVTPSWRALLAGNIEIGRLTLVRPTIILETDAEGRPNWEFEPEAGAKQAPGEAAKGFHLTIGKLAIERGTLTYNNPHAGRAIVANNIEAMASVGSLQGPFQFKGTATVNDLPLTIDLLIGEASGNGHRLKLGLKLDIGTLDFNGAISEIGPKASLAGHLAVTTSSMPEFVTKLVRASGQAAPTLHPAVSGRFTFDGGVEVRPDKLAISNFTLSFGGDEASGSLALLRGERTRLEGQVTVPKVDADKWQRALDQPNGLIPEETKAKIKQAVKTKSLSPFPPEMDVTLAVNVGQLTLAKGVLHDVSLAVDIREATITLARLSARLPGDMILKAQSGAEFELSGGKPRETLAWFGMKTDAIPKERLQRLEIKGRFTGSAGKVQVSDATFTLDDQQGKGAAEVVLGPPTALALTLDIERLDLDAYVPPKPRGIDISLPTVAAPTTPVATAPPAPDTAGVPITVKAKLGKLLFRTEVFIGIDSDVVLQGKLVKLNSLRIANALGGARASLRGQVSDLDTTPKYDLTVDINAPDADRVMGFVGIPVLRGGPIGAASITGGVAGSGKTATLKGVRANFLGVAAQVTGTLSFDGKGRFDFSNFGLQTADASRLVAAASGRPTAGIGAVSMRGKLAGSIEKAVFSGEGELHGARMSGKVESTLTGRPQIVADLKVPGTLDLDKWLGVSAAQVVPADGVVVPAAPAAPAAAAPIAPRPGRVTGQSINVSALNSFDARIVLRTSAMMLASLKIDYCDVNATLRGGTLTVNKLTGQFYGGGVDFAGTVKTGRDGLALDFKGNVIGIYLAQMLRGTAGKNTFGGSQLTVALDGKVNAGNIQLSGAGKTPEQIRNSFKGSATLGGYVYPAVDAGTRDSLAFLAGIGSIFSDDASMASLVLKRFINRQNQLDGQVRLEGGAVITENQRIIGNGAQATLRSRTQVATAATQTTITFTVDGQGGSNLVTTVKGPLSAPDMDTDRVAAAR